VGTKGNGRLYVWKCKNTKALGKEEVGGLRTDEVARILAVWRDLGIKDLDGRRASAGFEPVGEHLAKLRSWETSRSGLIVGLHSKS